MVKPVRKAPNRSIDRDVSDVVKQAYGVIAENIKTSREAADKFRTGDYTLGQVPKDLDKMMDRVFGVTRRVNTAAFNVFEILVSELVSAAADRGRSGDGTASFAAADAGAMALEVRFKGTVNGGGERRARSPSTALRRPTNAKGPRDILAGPFTAHTIKSGPSLDEVVFDIDLRTGVLVAEITVPDGAAPGWYSALVSMKGEERPLGVIEVELTAEKPTVTRVRSDKSGRPS